MKTKVALLLSTAGLLNPNTASAETTKDWITPIIDIRARFEARDFDVNTGVDPDPSTALTTRERLGLKSKEWNGFSALLEGEFTQAVIDDYHGGAGPFANPSDPSNTVIPDPETNELNQGYIQYSGFDTVAKLGRQKIIYDNAAFIGDVGWRQNQQTFDAISLTNKSFAGWVLNYSYIDQVNRIYGSDADSPLTPAFSNVSDLDSQIHALNVSFSGISNLTLGAYAYLMDFKDRPRWDNDTYGVTAKTTLLELALYGEIAYQDGAGIANADEAWYSHFTATKSFGQQSLMLSIESFGDGFKTPLATAHAFNGFADAFTGGRIEGNNRGLTDVYLAYTIPLVWKMKWINTLHAFGDNEISTGYGWEYDSVLTKKFDDNLSALAKFAVFTSNDEPYIGAAALPTITQFSVQMDYTF
jgi:hypothetical protein